MRVVFGRTYAAEPDILVEQLCQNEPITEAIPSSSQTPIKRHRI